MKPLFVFLFLLLGFQAFSQQQPAPQSAEMQLKEYFFVMLKKGPNRDQNKETADKLQEAHMAHINQMAKEGKLAIAGPFGDDGDWRGIFIFKTKTLEEARALVEQDPMVKAGRLAYEIHPWWTMKGAKLD
ncbi:MAG TPA: YciI family protein [Daejeonella sp.]|nr:YciI family protein [Daejeonella sp.]